MNIYNVLPSKFNICSRDVFSGFVARYLHKHCLNYLIRTKSLVRSSIPRICLCCLRVVFVFFLHFKEGLKKLSPYFLISDVLHELVNGDFWAEGKATPIIDLNVLFLLIHCNKRY